MASTDELELLASSGDEEQPIQDPWADETDYSDDSSAKSYDEEDEKQARSPKLKQVNHP